MSQAVAGLPTYAKHEQEASPADTPPNDSDRNPIVDEQAWFVPIQNADVELPVHIAAAASAAFATRLRQAIGGKQIQHIPRMAYMSDDRLRSLAETTPSWPGASRFRFLVDVALKIISPSWHIVRRSMVLASVDKHLKDPASCDWITQCSLWALLAIGEVYSARCIMPSAPFPGAQYFAKAMALIKISPERPRLEVVEINLLLVSHGVSCCY